MTYIRLDYALIFFVIYLIVSMVHDFYRDYKYKMKPTDYDSGYRQAIQDFARQWNKSVKKSLEPRVFADEIRVYMQKQVNDWDVNGI